MAEPKAWANSLTFKEAAAESLGDDGDIAIVFVFDFLRTRSEGEVHVHAGVAIWDRENIKLVDFWIVVVKVVSAR